MERNKRRLMLRTILAVFLIAAAIGIIGALAPQQGAMQPTPTITSSLGAIPPYADRATATPPVVRAAPGTPPAPTATIMARSDATDRAATPGAPAPCPPMPTLTAEAGLLATLTNTTNRQGARTAQAGLLASLTATAYPGQDNPGAYATEHPPTPVPTATLTPRP